MRLRINLFLAIFYTVLFSYLLLLWLSPNSFLAKLSVICECIPESCLLVIFFLFGIGVVLTGIIDSYYKHSYDRRLKIPRIISRLKAFLGLALKTH
jgi:UDP-N-acetylmuramyl pentapeptide phosphotransferase/UDP-N-acetylglucosamine-1-phosphate transferase